LNQEKQKLLARIDELNEANNTLKITNKEYQKDSKKTKSKNLELESENKRLSDARKEAI